MGKLGAIVGVLTACYVGFEISNLMACNGAVALMGVGSSLIAIQANFSSSSNKSPRKGGGERDGSSNNTPGARHRASSTDSSTDSEVRTISPRFLFYGGSDREEDPKTKEALLGLDGEEEDNNEF